MTIKEFCLKYEKTEANVRAKINRNKDKLEGHITKTPYSKTYVLDEFAIDFLLNDKRTRLCSQDSGKLKAENNNANELNDLNVDMYQHWSEQKKEKVMTVCMNEVRRYYKVLSYIPDSFKTYELCKYAVENQGLALEFVPTRFLTEELCNIAVNSNGVALAFVPEGFITKEMAIAALTNYKDACKKINGSMNISQHELEHNLLKFVPEKFRDKPICLLALSNDSCNAKYIPRKYFSDEDIINEALKDSISRKYIPNGYWNVDNIIETIKNFKHGMQGIPRELFSYEFYIRLIDEKLIKPEDIYVDDYYSGILTPQERESIRNIDFEKREFHDKLYNLIIKDGNNIRLMSVDDECYETYSLIAVAGKGSALKYVPMEKRDYNKCEAAVVNDSNAIVYVPEEYKKKLANDIKRRNDWLKFVFDDSYFADFLLNEYSECQK